MAKQFFTAENAEAITPNDTTTGLQYIGVYVGGAGNLTVDMVGGGTVTFTAVAAGTFLPISVRRVYTSSTATLMLGLK